MAGTLSPATTRHGDTKASFLVADPKIVAAQRRPQRFPERTGFDDFSGGEYREKVRTIAVCKSSGE